VSSNKDNVPGTDLMKPGKTDLKPKAHGPEGIRRLEKLMNDSGTHMVLHEPDDFSARLKRIERGDVEDGVNTGVLEHNTPVFLAVPEEDFSIRGMGSSSSKAVDDLCRKREKLKLWQTDNPERLGDKFIKVNVHQLVLVETELVLSPFDDPE